MLEGAVQCVLNAVIGNKLQYKLEYFSEENTMIYSYDQF